MRFESLIFSFELFEHDQNAIYTHAECGVVMEPLMCLSDVSIVVGAASSLTNANVAIAASLQYTHIHIRCAMCENEHVHLK